MEMDAFAQPQGNNGQLTQLANVTGYPSAQNAGQALAILIGYFNKDVKRNRELASLNSAQTYITRHPNKGYRVAAEDLDNDIDTPANTVVYGRQGNVYAVDGFYTKQGFGTKNKKGVKKLRNRDILTGYYTDNSFENRRQNKGNKIQIGRSNLTPFQIYQAQKLGKIDLQNNPIASTREASNWEKFRAYVRSKLVERLGAEYVNHNTAGTMRLAGQIWRTVQVMAVQQLDPQRQAINAYKAANDAQEFSDVKVAQRLYDTKKAGYRFTAAITSILAEGIDQILATEFQRLGVGNQ
ncbi:MAG: hypothetical protein EZS28_014773 [Streblomastix strix]|uniref:Uncharacterized protein n=1 Tax=Streblomastix strix TaxID=222440 RepID=A0A5J4W5J2_9EUKA|nr:MAG: hypothetical protein EZS28_014773 [Streblomastix strix]